MIKTFTVRGFRSLHSLDKLELGRINVFIGANGAGKSNVLEALGTLGAAASGKVSEPTLLERGVRPGAPEIFKSAFQDADILPAIFLTAESENGRYSVGLRNPTTELRPMWLFHSEKVEELEDDGRWHKLFGISGATANRPRADRGLAAAKLGEAGFEGPAGDLVEALAEYRIYSPHTPYLRGLVGDPGASDPVGLGGGLLPEAVEELMEGLPRKHRTAIRERLFELIPWAKKLSAAEVSEMDVPRSVPTTKIVLSFQDRYMKRGRNKLSGYDASEGALFVLFAFVVGLHPRSPKIAAIDNFDHGLNPRLVRGLASDLEQWTRELAPDRQLLLTCQNPSALDGFGFHQDDVRLFAVDRNRSGFTTVRRVKVTPKMIELAKTKGYTLSQMWVEGVFGAVPNV